MSDWFGLNKIIEYRWFWKNIEILKCWIFFNEISNQCIPLHQRFVWVMCTEPLTCCSWFLYFFSFSFRFSFLSCLPKSVSACWAIREKMHSIELRGKKKKNRFFQELTEHVQCGLLKGYCLGYCTHQEQRSFVLMNFNLFH